MRNLETTTNVYEIPSNNINDYRKQREPNEHSQRTPHPSRIIDYLSKQHLQTPTLPNLNHPSVKSNLPNPMNNITEGQGNSSVAITSTDRTVLHEPEQNNTTPHNMSSGNSFASCRGKNYAADEE
jgi:hypothetical protein